MLHHRVAILLTILLLPAKPSLAEMGRPSPRHTASLPGQPANGIQDRITVWGRKRHFFPAPMANNAVVDPGPTGLGPGSKLGIATIEGGPIRDAVHNGISAGIAIPVAGVRGLDFTVTETGSRDMMAASGTTGAASTTAGLRLKF